ncbi:RND family efflux transporter MFP subunit [Herbaspirillum sp. Sphag1AN]|nr:RND family efflux transporter MFP subunit [Herbaspirillum sp. Sphag1AN]MBB3244337.1 RND family efflux transporter MFP subunit [Herbaspirillum sp. Sphag64]
MVKMVAVVSAAPLTQSFTGIIGSRVQSDLGFRVSGKVLQRLVDTGESVKRGQLLVRIDPIDLGLEANARTEAVAAARAHAKQAIADEVRYRDLVAAGAVSASAYDQIKATADSAKAELNAAQAQADVARNATNYTELMADSDGVVVETLAEPGQVVSAGQVVVRLAHAGPREAVIQLPETLRPTIGSQATATLYGQDKADNSAKLRQLSDAADRLTRTYEARYVLNSTLANAPLGATVTVTLADKRTGNATGVQVPSSAVFDAGKESGVWVLNGSPAKVSWRPVHVLNITDEAARVDGNLQTGEQIVALGAHLLHEGELVRIQAAPALALPAGTEGEKK